ncbi:formate--tetrahydrofolate ligase [Anaeropeptidivorans aminofermentans]|jgi:formate--tetrahydrofolate ligase|uniref:formate--tetrahydrofolate ligase n=1 Tax=Anaeropeptidivorans aminofermentans TaxID=2934315 RepID=UPI002023F50B|nr:formate--tetrahydrofolate ligase [Anaeropeptidivorans aminofermentans]MBE6011736.1 formate--tetrahydrofolate ligase [Lachnospiraceae bacterium]
MKTDIQIAQESEPLRIEKVAESVGLSDDNLFHYGKYKAKVDHRLLKKYEDRPDAKVILVTAISPTPAGEGKTTTTVGLGDALKKIGKRTVICLREPSLGPVFGVKGGAAGGGYAQVIPMEDINLHFTGDLHAIGAANNLLAAMLDNHIYQGNALNIDPRRIAWKRAIDMNDRQLRFIVDGLSGKTNGVPREDGFDITVASEIMAVFCLSTSLQDLKDKLSKMVVAYTYDNKAVTAGELNAHGALAALLKDAFDPNLVQTLEHTPAFIHGGPFANIAHGCNSVVATRLAMKLSDYVVTEAGFGADLGAEKFIDIKCRKAGIRPSAVVIVATVRALKHHGGATKENWGVEDLDVLEKGFENLRRHIENVTKVYGLPAVVAVNRFPTDTEKELQFVIDKCKAYGAEVALSEVFSKGSEGGIELAEKILQASEKESNFSFVYDTELSVKDKIKAIANKVYGAKDVVYTAPASKTIKEIEELGYGNLPICIAKTQYSFSDNAKLLCAPENFEITIRQVRLSAGAGFIVAISGEIMTMPGLPKVPSAEKIDVDDDGVISGLF